MVVFWRVWTCLRQSLIKCSTWLLNELGMSGKGRWAWWMGDVTNSYGIVTSLSIHLVRLKSLHGQLLVPSSQIHLQLLIQQSLLTLLTHHVLLHLPLLWATCCMHAVSSTRPNYPSFSYSTRPMLYPMNSLWNGWPILKSFRKLLHKIQAIWAVWWIQWAWCWMSFTIILKSWVCQLSLVKVWMISSRQLMKLQNNMRRMYCL